MNALPKFFKRQSAARLNGSEVSLADAPVDRDMEVCRIETADAAKVNRLAALGILPGASVRLIQNRSAYVAVVERDQVAFDSQVARAVWVRRASERA